MFAKAHVKVIYEPFESSRRFRNLYIDKIPEVSRDVGGGLNTRIVSLAYDPNASETSQLPGKTSASLVALIIRFRCPMSEENASLRGIEESGGITPNNSIRLEPFFRIPAIPRSPFSASTSPSDDAVSNEEDVHDGHGSTVATHAESDQGRSGWISECLLWFVSCRRCWRKQSYESEYIVLFSNASDLGSRACLLSGESLNQHVASFVSRTVT